MRSWRSSAKSWDSASIGFTAYGLGLGHRALAEGGAELLLDPDEQLDALEAADPEIALQRVVQRHAPPGPRLAEIRQQPGHDVEDVPLESSCGERQEHIRAATPVPATRSLVRPHPSRAAGLRVI